MVRFWVVFCMALVGLSGRSVAQVSERDVIDLIYELAFERDEIATGMAALWQRGDLSNYLAEFDQHERSTPGYSVRLEYRVGMMNLQTRIRNLRSQFETAVTNPSPTARNVCEISDDGVLVRRHDANVANVSLYGSVLLLLNEAFSYADHCLNEAENYGVAFGHLGRAAFELVIVDEACEAVRDELDDIFLEAAAIRAAEIIDWWMFAMPRPSMNIGGGGMVVPTLP